MQTLHLQQIKLENEINFWKKKKKMTQLFEGWLKSPVH